jgi:hypothetical protein
MGERLLLRFGLSPCRWREIFDLVDLGRREADKQVLKILERIDPMPLATAQKGINHCAMFAGFRVTNEHSFVLARALGRTFVTVSPLCPVRPTQTAFGRVLADGHHGVPERSLICFATVIYKHASPTGLKIRVHPRPSVVENQTPIAPIVQPKMNSKKSPLPLRHSECGPPGMNGLIFFVSISGNSWFNFRT